MRFCYARKQCLLIHLPKEIDHCQAEEIRKECETMFLRACIRDVIFDFTNTIFMDSSGIGLILGRIRQVSPLGGKVYLFGGSLFIRKMWEMAGIMGNVTVLETMEEMKEVYE
ncbi:MAG: STAS domain-containing protein [Clostridiales bacterium]|nr:STAS domain-containing protein [Clostridiales bacterium]